MIETSVEAFVEEFSSFAVCVKLYPQPEGSTLMEACLGTHTMYLLDRTGPYRAYPGEAKIIVHPVAESVTRCEPVGEMRSELKLLGVSRIAAKGQVAQVAQGLVVVNTPEPMVVGVFDDSWEHVSVGDWVHFTSLEPIHGFFV